MEQDTYTRAELIEAMQFVSILTQLCEMHSRYDEAVPAALCNLIKRHFVQGDYCDAFGGLADYLRLLPHVELDPPSLCPHFLLRAAEQQSYRTLN